MLSIHTQDKSSQITGYNDRKIKQKYSPRHVGPIFLKTQLRKKTLGRKLRDKNACKDVYFPSTMKAIHASVDISMYVYM